VIEPQITELAEKLGKAMADSQRTRQFKEAANAVRGDEAAQKALADFQNHSDALARKQAENQPIEVEEKRELSRLQEKIYSHDNLKQFMAAQADYMELVQKVNDILSQHLVDEQPTAEGEAKE
jgi:cell fate (sporulation/competence/biofilm development) regulator YlbF (YheA/YmcA/DUF963 family)